MEKTIDTSDAPELVIECKNNDLKLHGQDEHSVVVESDDEQVKVIITGNRIVISANAETEIHAPHATIVHMTDVGDLKIYEISGGIDVGNIGGDLRGEDVGAITIQNVGGDCDLEDVNGPVRISSVSGDCKLEGVTDSINIGAVGGDLKAEDVAFVGTSVSVGGDVSLKIMPGREPGSINAGGDVSLELAEGANATLSITDSEGMRQIKFGNGTAAIKISAGGDVSVRADGEEHERGDDEYQGVKTDFSWNFDFSDTMRDFERGMAEMQRGIETMARDFSTRFSGTGPGVSQATADRIRMQTEAGARRVEEKLTERMRHIEQHAQRAAHKAQRSAARAAEKAIRHKMRNQHGRGFNATVNTRVGAHFGSPMPPIPPIPPAPPVPPMPPFSNQPFEAPRPKGASDDERLLILRMLQDKKISTEQAEQLLAALDQ